jgi:hypothetical protein
VIPIIKRIREFFLMRHQQNAAHMSPEVLQFLDHHLPALTVKATEAFIDDNGLDRPVLMARILADA